MDRIGGWQQDRYNCKLVGFPNIAHTNGYYYYYARFLGSAFVVVALRLPVCYRHRHRHRRLLVRRRTTTIACCVCRCRE
jgi:hypothetical protein